MRFLPDWLIYLLVAGAIVLVLFRIDTRHNAPRILPGAPASGQLLPPPSEIDPEVLVEVAPVTTGLGSAFAISREGWWLTARHVVDPSGCARVGVIVGRGAALEARVYPAQFADLALLRTNGAPAALPVRNQEGSLRVGQTAFHIGFPQGRTGEAVSRLIGRETLVSRGRYAFEEPVLAWAETGRTEGLHGSLAGISGGPALDASGAVIGVTIAESSRRGRIYTATPATIMQLLDVQRVSPARESGPRLTMDNYGEEADDLRRSLAVAQVICIGRELLGR